MKPIKFCIFDLAGTTVSDPGSVEACLVEALGERGVSVPSEEVRPVMGWPKPVAIQHLLRVAESGLAESADQVHAIHSRFRILMLEFYKVSPDVKELEGVSATFRTLADMGCTVAANTGFDRTITDLLLERMAWGSLVADVITSDEVERGRPFPDMILALLSRNGFTANETLKAGDTVSDLGEGKAARVALNVGVLSGTHTAEQFGSWSGAIIVDSVRDVPRLISEREEREAGTYNANQGE